MFSSYSGYITMNTEPGRNAFTNQPEAVTKNAILSQYKEYTIPSLESKTLKFEFLHMLHYASHNHDSQSMDRLHYRQNF